MFEAALDIHDPTDKRSHSILRFFSEDLTEDEKIEFVRLIFKRGSWTLSTEISRTSQSIKLSEETKNIFKQILEKWVLERIEHSKNRLSAETKNPYLPKKYSYEFREAIIAAKDLDFHPDLMLIIEKFLNECYRAYLDKFIDRVFWLVIDDFSTRELEIFFLYFSDLFINNSSDNIGNFLYLFLRSLAYSPKIFFLSDSFLENLNQLSLKIKSLGKDNDHSLLISVLLIELITFKELNLSKAEYANLILPTINKLERGNLDNLELLSFLHNFNYKFESYNFKEEIDSLLNSIEANILKVEGAEEITKKAILHHFVKSSNEYFELLVFQLEFIKENDRIIEFKRFIKLIDRLRSSFMKVMWFKEYDNFVPIEGKIVKALPDGFGVELNSCYINEFLNRQTFKDLRKKEFIRDNLFGFANKRAFKKSSDLNEYYSFLKQNPLKKSYKNRSLDSVSRINLFHISAVNYSSSNKGSVINLMPFSDSIYNLLNSFKIKSFFSCTDIFLANEACNLLNVVSPFVARKYSPVFVRLLPSTLKPQAKLDLHKDKFWEIIKEYRPNLYNETYIKVKQNEKRFEELIEIYNSGKIIQGTIKSRTKGGFYVDIQGQQAFLPGSQIEYYIIPDYDSYIDKTMDFKIVKIYHEYKSAVVSHRIIYEEERVKQKTNLLSKLKKGLVLTGIVKNITSYGVFMDLGGVDGLIYISNLSWLRVEHPSEIVEIDQQIDVKVIDFDLESSKIDLGLKQLQPHPWDGIDSKIFKEQVIKGKISKLVPTGAVIEVLPGVEGLAHISQISDDLYSCLNVGQEILVKVIFIDFPRKKIRFSLDFINQVHPSKSKYLEFDEKVRVGDIFDGVVLKRNKGTGLIKIEGIDTIAVICPSRHMKKKDGKLAEPNDKMKFKLLEIDKGKSRLIVSHSATLKSK